MNEILRELQKAFNQFETIKNSYCDSGMRLYEAAEVYVHLKNAQRDMDKAMMILDKDYQRHVTEQKALKIAGVK